MKDPSAAPAAPGTLGELYALGQALEDALGRLLDHASVHYYDINAGQSDVFVVGANPNRWGELDGAGQHALGLGRTAADAWAEHIEHAIRTGAEERLRSFEKYKSSIDQVLRRSGAGMWAEGAPAGTIEEIRQKVGVTIQKTGKLVADLPTANGTGGRLFVPDTNALIHEPAIETWQLPQGPCSLVFVPQVVRELDAKKMDARIGEKASAVIRRLKEYGRRGDTFVGVPLVGGTTVREVAHDASVDESLAWLRASHADDQLLASVLALKWADLRCDVGPTP